MRLLGLLAALAGAAACSAQPAPAEPPAGAAASPRQEPPMDQSPGPPVRELPFAQGLSFSTLDDYLAHLRKRGAYGVPYYRETGPGLYERVTGRRAPGQAPPETISREELARRYGFEP